MKRKANVKVKTRGKGGINSRKNRCIPVHFALLFLAVVDQCFLLLLVEDKDRHKQLLRNPTRVKTRTKKKLSPSSLKNEQTKTIEKTKTQRCLSIGTSHGGRAYSSARCPARGRGPVDSSRRSILEAGRVE
jgi:hypothetical protein